MAIHKQEVADTPHWSPCPEPWICPCECQKCTEAKFDYYGSWPLEQRNAWQKLTDLGPVWDSTGYLTNPVPPPRCASCGYRTEQHKQEGMAACLYLLVKENNRLRERPIPTKCNGWWLIANDDVEFIRVALTTRVRIQDSNKHILHQLDTALHLTDDVPGDFR